MNLFILVFGFFFLLCPIAIRNGVGGINDKKHKASRFDYSVRVAGFFLLFNYLVYRIFFGSWSFSSYNKGSYFYAISAMISGSFLVITKFSFYFYNLFNEFEEVRKDKKSLRGHGMVQFVAGLFILILAYFDIS